MRLGPADDVPAWAQEPGELVCTVRTAHELSLVVPEERVEGDVRVSRGWRALGVRGPLPFDMVGVMASITTPLAEAAVSVIAIATFDTDYVLVAEDRLDVAIEALRTAAHTLHGA